MLHPSYRQMLNSASVILLLTVAYHFRSICQNPYIRYKADEIHSSSVLVPRWTALLFIHWMPCLQKEPRISCWQALPDEPHSAGEYFAPVPYLLARYSKEIKLLAAILTNLLLLQFSNNRSIVINKKGRWNQIFRAIPIISSANRFLFYTVLYGLLWTFEINICLDNCISCFV